MTQSYFFSIPLRGVGGVDVESLPSYLCRLSAAHAVSIKTVLAHAVSWLRHSSELERSMPSAMRYPGRIASFVRPNPTTGLLVDALEAATQQTNLRCATFLALRQAVHHCGEALTAFIRWCPECMREFDEQEDAGYMKMQWLLADLQCCLTHGAPLISACPHCDRDQNGCTRRERATRCAHCKQPLYSDLIAYACPGAWKTHAVDLLDLVREIASDPQLLYPANGSRAVVTEMCNRRRDVRDRQVRMLLRGPTVSAAVEGRLISFATARRLSFYFGIRLADLLAGTVEGTPAVLDPTWTADLPAGM